MLNIAAFDFVLEAVEVWIVSVSSNANPFQSFFFLRRKSVFSTTPTKRETEKCWINIFPHTGISTLEGIHFQSNLESFMTKGNED
jgi:hypothetical protein